MPAWFRDLTEEARDQRTELYAAALADLTDADVLAAATLACSRCKFFPTPVELREFVQPRASVEAAITAQAGEVYEAVLAAHARGEQPGFREIANAYGDVAAVAFIASGGTAAFTWCEPGRDESFRLKRWMEAWREAAQARHAESRALAAGATSTPQQLPPGAIEARRLLGEIASRCPACGSREARQEDGSLCADKWHGRSDPVQAGAVLRGLLPAAEVARG